MYVSAPPAARRARRPPAPGYAYRARVPSFARVPVGAFVGQGEEEEAEYLSPEGAELLPLPTHVYMGDLGRPRRRRRGGFGEFLRRGGIVGWIGRQQIVRKVLPRPITAAMRLEFEKVPGAALKQFLEPAKPLTGLFAGTKKRRRPIEEAPQMIDTALLPTPQPEVPAPIARGRSYPGDFAPPPYAPAGQMWGDVPPDMPSPEEMMAPEAPGAEAYEVAERRGLVPGAEEAAYPAPPAALMPGEAPGGGWVTTEPLAPGPSGELVTATGYDVGPTAEMLERTEEEPTMALGQGPRRIYWWQPTPPYLAPPYVGHLGQPEWFRTTARVVAAAGPAVARALAPQPEEYFAPGPTFAAPAPVALPARPAAGVPGWLWLVGGAGILGAVWFMGQPRR